MLAKKRSSFPSTPLKAFLFGERGRKRSTYTSIMDPSLGGGREGWYIKIIKVTVLNFNSLQQQK